MDDKLFAGFDIEELEV
ncbi:hypothetical protein, partial [Frankia casuarinae]